MKIFHSYPVAALLGLGLAGILPAATPSINITPFGSMADGRAVNLYSLVNASGARADITNYGAIIVRLFVPDRAGRFDDVVLGYNSLADYQRASPYFGAVVGRYGNRIAEGRFTLDGRTYPLVTNNAPGGIPCHLHGGTVGFDKVLWTAEPSLVDAAPALTLRYRSRDGEEGYPGNLDVTIRYQLGEDNSLSVEYRATTDQSTPVNLTQHSYFNLGGEGRGDILDHVLTLNASRFTPVNAGLIPTGELAPVAGTPFDFRQPRAIGERVDEPDEQLKFGGGYDHNFVLDRPEAGGLAHAATVFEPKSGRVLEVWTEEPGVQFYCGNFLNGSHVGKSGRAYARRYGLCLETQHFPNSPNQPSFPDTILRPGREYRTRTIFKFSAR